MHPCPRGHVAPLKFPWQMKWSLLEAVGCMHELIIESLFSLTRMQNFVADAGGYNTLVTLLIN